MPKTRRTSATSMALQFNVAQLMKQPTGARREYDVFVDDLLIEDGPALVAPLTGRVHFVRAGGGILVTGAMRTVARLRCSRCLSEFDREVVIDLEEEFQPVVNIATGSPIPLSDEQDTANLIDEHHILDLTEVVRQYLCLAVPLSLLCSEDCKGLCPYCGKNLNEGSCTCGSERIDPRWAVLLEGSSDATD